MDIGVQEILTGAQVLQCCELSSTKSCMDRIFNSGVDHSVGRFGVTVIPINNADWCPWQCCEVTCNRSQARCYERDSRLFVSGQNRRFSVVIESNKFRSAMLITGTLHKADSAITICVLCKISRSYLGG